MMPQEPLTIMMHLKKRSLLDFLFHLPIVFSKHYMIFRKKHGRIFSIRGAMILSRCVIETWRHK